MHVGRQDVAEMAQPLHRDIEQHDLRADAGGHFRRVLTDDAAAEYHHLAGRDTGHSGQQHAAPAVQFLKIFRALLHGHASGHF